MKTFKLTARIELRKKKREQVAFLVLATAAILMVVAILKF